jgi:hypothetical protein
VISEINKFGWINIGQCVFDARGISCGMEIWIKGEAD